VRGVLSLSFDDGNKTDLTIGYQGMIDRNIKPRGTTFLIPSFVAPTRLTLQERIDLINGGWDMECHTYNHAYAPDLTELTPNEIREELKLVNEYFIDILGIPSPTVIAYPGGATNDYVKGIIKPFRKMARGTQEGFITRNPDMLELQSFSFITNTLDKLKWVIDMVNTYGLYADIRMHELETTEDIEKYGLLLDYIKQTNTRLVDMRELYQLLNKNESV